MGRAFEVRKAAMAKTSAMKSKLYSRYGKEIYLAAKAGEADVNMNMSLKRIVDKAKANQVPSDVIKRAIEKAKGGSNESYNSVMYEGFLGPATILVECLTDNTNRSIANVRAAFNKSHAKLGTAGSVSFNYVHQAYLVFDASSLENVSTDDILDLLLEHDVDVIEVEQESNEISITVAANELYHTKEVLEDKYPGIEFSALESVMQANEMVEIDGEEKMLFERLVNLLNDDDDVQNLYHNVSNLDK